MAGFLLAPYPEAQELYQIGPFQNPGGDTGVDLRLPRDVLIEARETKIVNLGVRAICLGQAGPAAFFLLARSSFAASGLIAASGLGLIDQGYRGELRFAVHNPGPGPCQLEKGRSLWQLAAADLRPATGEVLGAEDPRMGALFAAEATLRGARGFGSTGRAGQGAPGAGLAALRLDAALDGVVEDLQGEADSGVEGARQEETEQGRLVGHRVAVNDRHGDTDQQVRDQ
jgi:dUTPase